MCAYWKTVRADPRLRAENVKYARKPPLVSGKKKVRVVDTTYGRKKESARGRYDLRAENVKYARKPPLVSGKKKMRALE